GFLLRNGYLVDALTIKVSCFFRNPLVFELLREVVLPELIEKGRNDILRIWCAGCARGEEAYSAAILVREIVTKEALPAKVFIIGTDIDRAALENAKKAAYKADSVLEIKKCYLDRYFDVKDGFYHLKEEITSLVTFAYHDVTTLTTTKEGIFSDYHLILCRNVLIYFNRELSERVLRGFSGFLLRNGYLVLGEAESFMPQLTKDYEGIMRGTKIFKRK
ncbi:MAG: protein-glutamate O-methyltransferase CheR, partial [Nitrospirae bacterium]|nr:protein-glutamate O-methyltransferase CheR [Nitrospirota bacterium]